MEDIEFVPAGVRETEYGNILLRDVKLKVDIQLGDTIYKDTVLTIPEQTLQSIVWKYETSHC